MKLKSLFRMTAVATAVAATSVAAYAEDPRVNFYNWSDYIAEETLPNFTKETGIAVTYDVFDTNEVLEAKLLAGNTGFDIVVPGSDFMGRQIQAGAFLPLDKAKIPNYDKLDPAIMKLLEDKDPGNKHGIPYMWGTTGIGYNVAKIKEAFGEDVKVDSWDFVFKPENLAKLAKCGVAFLDSPTEIYATALNYLGMDPNSTKPEDYSGPATDLMLKIRPHITYFHGSKYINDLANGDICVAVGWSGDVFQAAARAEEAGKNIEIAYVIPKEGAQMWFDILTIPKDAKHPDNAHKLINYLLDPNVAAANSNYVAYANPVPASKAFIDKEILENPGIYPTAEIEKKLFVAKAVPQNVSRAITRAWTRVRTGK